METIYTHFTQVLDKYHQSGKQVVLALSGGVDSRLLLEFLRRYQLTKSMPCQAVYVHHGLSLNADMWAEKCQQWAKQAGVPCAIEYVTLDMGGGDSIEHQAREARYAALAKYLGKGGLLLTGQHADDQLETFLLALKRGSGPKGLSSMAEAMSFGPGQIVRPLLGVSRNQIECEALTLELEWVEDESNQDTRYDRNFIRHQIVPQLTKRWPSIRQAAQRSASLCAEQEALLDELLDGALQQALHIDMSLQLAPLKEHSKSARNRLLRMWLARLHAKMPSQKQLELLWHEVALAQPDANPQLNLADGQIRRFQNRLYWVTKTLDVTDWMAHLEVDVPLNLPDHLGSLTLQTGTAHPAIALPAHPERLLVAFNPEGLMAHPTTRGHRRKLKKLFQEYHVPSWLRRRIPILMYQDQVVAVADLFVDQAFSGQDCELIWRK
ncbi:tRNA lysidine(34) synthetase TilS [Vibrio sp. CAU 1672]|uniref:tRNA lysidine(34) synthetase TilS n=1 Tax=Vibrio sp. CAU 1672 TaxID=3032594 RepID=UPI0023D98781|nr:tRNA lysidine(34) synthetase TilS [Vibrio sp. CAU 1672]MDF2155524.1 tRNA lysidine(34) synthetase TilS [Vibrio sp. CAU 1672]